MAYLAIIFLEEGKYHVHWLEDILENESINIENDGNEDKADKIFSLFNQIKLIYHLFV